MRIIRAKHLGMCFGVRDAINLAVETAAREPVTVLGELVHNKSVLSELQMKGVRTERRIENVDTKTAMVTAHGSSRRSIGRAKARGLNIIEATCPLVHFAHRAVEEMVGDGLHPVIIGKRDHVEVRGIVDDLEEFDVVLEDEDIGRLRKRPRFGVVAQTTQPIDRVRTLVRLLRDRFPTSEVRFMDTVCQPTKQRQTAAVEVANKSDVVVVVGGSNSNNTHQLVATCRKYCRTVYQVQNAAGLQPEWFVGARIVGLTAGTSTPDSVIDEVESRLNCIATETAEHGRDSYRAFEPVADAESVHAPAGVSALAPR